MNDSQAIYALIRGVLEKWIAGCRGCKGRGEVCEDIPNHPVNYKRIPCTTCAPWRAMVKVVCWHEWDGEKRHHFLTCKKCGFDTPGYHSWASSKETFMVQKAGDSDHINPDLTTAMEGSRLTIVRLLQDAGM